MSSLENDRGMQELHSHQEARLRIRLVRLEGELRTYQKQWKENNRMQSVQMSLTVKNELAIKEWQQYADILQDRIRSKILAINECRDDLMALPRYGKSIH